MLMKVTVMPTNVFSSSIALNLTHNGVSTMQNIAVKAQASTQASPASTASPSVTASRLGIFNFDPSSSSIPVSIAAKGADIFHYTLSVPSGPCTEYQVKFAVAEADAAKVDLSSIKILDTKNLKCTRLTLAIVTRTKNWDAITISLPGICAQTTATVSPENC